jgi:hypothetical protein
MLMQTSRNLFTFSPDRFLTLKEAAMTICCRR